MKRINRRQLLSGGVGFLFGQKLVEAGVIAGKLPPPAQSMLEPTVADAHGWRFFSAAEAQTMQAIVDRIIPPDPETPGGRDAGCAVFIDRQLAGGYGHREGLYVQGPFKEGSKEQGTQSASDPAREYRDALAALDRYCRSAAGTGATSFDALPTARQDEVLKGIEDGSISLAGVDGKTFFKHLVTDVQQGFFADPIYGGNRNMCAWKMIGFPGARYDHRDWVSRHNEPYPYPPVSILGRADWNPRKV